MIVGASGTGKTTFLCRYFFGSQFDRAWIFDGQGELAGRLGVAPITSAEKIPAALESGQRVLLYDPAEEYPGDTAAGFDFFCGLAFRCSQAETGRKIFFTDELQQATDTGTITPPLACVLETGRRYGLDFAGITQAANLVHNRLRNQVTELVAFRSIDERALAFCETCGLDGAALRETPPGAYLGRNLMTGETYGGKVF